MEEWRDIPGFEGLYQASAHGHIRSLDRVVLQAGAFGYMIARQLRGKVLSIYYHAVRKSERVKISATDRGFKAVVPVQQLVALTFFGPPKKGMVIWHKDGNARNNRPSNLCYVTRKYILALARPWRRKVSAAQAQEIRDRFSSGEARVSIAQDFKVSLSTVYRIGTSRRHANA